MATLRLRQHASSAGRHRVTLQVTRPGYAPREAASEFTYEVSAEDAADVRWYLEDYLEYPLDPAPQRAARIEHRLAELGRALFDAVFAGIDAQRIWVVIADRLAEVRVEVATDVDAASAVPWELLRDPATDAPLALSAASFVRVNHRPATDIPLPDAMGHRLRVLLVICRPGADNDVPFRSVARQLVSLGADARGILDLQVLRPPTYPNLAKELEGAKAAGRPYQVVHFDGHGTYRDSGSLRDDAGGSGSPGRIRYGPLSPPRPGSHGYLLFEDPDRPGNELLVDGPALGRLLASTGVPVLLLNACRSAYSEARSEPTGDAVGDEHSQVRAYGSLALEASDAGLAGVVAMRYNVYVVTAAQFVADLYAALLAGQHLGQAATTGRRRLADQPYRSIAFDPRPLQDWSVPVVYESAPLALFTAPIKPQPDPVVDATTDTADVGGLPASPEIGFFGRDETLLALDRAFDRNRVVLLHAYAGSGKTATAVEFARWYAATGGLGDQPLVWFSSLDRYTPLASLLNTVGDTFDGRLQAAGVHWQTLTDRERRVWALRLLEAAPVLWIWDNVEPVAGFPAGTRSAWSDAEQAELVGFLRDAARTKARLLLTSRRDEAGWLADLPTRLTLPAMPMRERIQLTQALAERQAHRLDEVEDWRPLLRYTDGNPLAITVLVGQALRQRLTRKTQVDDFVARLRAGETDVDDDASLGRSRSLGASLAYGFATAFTDRERAQLGWLCLFQEAIDANALVLMGDPDNPGRVADLAGMTHEQAVALLDRAADIGLLGRYSAGYYRIHPALPWYFRRLNHQTGAGGAARPDPIASGEAGYAFAFSELGRAYWDRHIKGHAEVVASLAFEEGNLLYARILAWRAGRWAEVIGCMQGIRILYEQHGRISEWTRLVDELIPDLTDPDTGHPRPGRDTQWSALIEYRIALARRARDWTGAEELLATKLAVDRDRAADALTVEPTELDYAQRSRIRNLAVDLQYLGALRGDQNQADCLTPYYEAGGLFQRLGARRDEGTTAFNLGKAYVTVRPIRDLDQAERWFLRSLDLYDDQHGRAQVTAQLGMVAYQRSVDARAACQPDHMVLALLTIAADHYIRALEALPDFAVVDHAVAHKMLGAIHRSGDQPDLALSHYQQAIAYFERAADRYGAGQTRVEVAMVFTSTGRTADALAYAYAALRDTEPYGASAAALIDGTRRLIDYLEQLPR